MEAFEEYLCHKCLDKYSFLKPYLNSHMFFSGQYNKDQRVNATSDENKDSKSSDKMSLPLTAQTSNKDNEIAATKTEGASSTISLSTPVNNKRKIEEDDKADDCKEVVNAVVSLKKSKNDDVNTCKRESWQIVSNEVEIDLFCVRGWRDELCRCHKVFMTDRAKIKITCFIKVIIYNNKFGHIFSVWNFINNIKLSSFSV